MTASGVRLAYLVTHPIQYQAPLLRYLGGLPELDLTVFFVSPLSAGEYDDPDFGCPVRWDVPLLEGYRHEFLPCLWASKRLSFWNPIPTGFRELLLRGRFEALWVHGYAHNGLLRGLVAARRMGLRILLRGESHLGSHPRGPLRRVLKRLIAPPLFRCVDGFLTIGSLNRQYYEHYGASPDRFFAMPYAVDNEQFRTLTEAARPERAGLRAALGLSSNRPVILFASKLIERKRPRDLLEAYARLSPDGRTEPEPYLLFVGEGLLRSALENRAAALGWNSIRFLGFKNQSELPRLYDLCDVFVLPSEFEPWGLVVNEVMNAAKPIIVSSGVGAGPDLVREGVNGFITPVGSVDHLAAALRATLLNAATTEAMGTRSLELIRGWGFEQDRDGLMQALAALFPSRAVRPG